ncbi:MAG: hypothetical protein ACI91B_004244 [Planctomycetota bacterium]|jgi:hypothetical protein
MSHREGVIIRGEVHVSLSAVAGCYGVRVDWVEEVYELGLLGTGEQVADDVVISAEQLDRVAHIVRLHFYQGVNLSGVSMLLDIDLA